MVLKATKEAKVGIWAETSPVKLKAINKGTVIRFRP